MKFARFDDDFGERRMGLHAHEFRGGTDTPLDEARHHADGTSQFNNIHVLGEIALDESDFRAFVRPPE